MSCSCCATLARSLARFGERARVDDFEVVARQPAERVEVVVRPVRVRRAGDVPGRAVVGEDHPVDLQRLQHDAGLRRELRDVDARLQPHAQAHRRERRARRVRREVPRGIDVRAARLGAVKRSAWSIRRPTTSSQRASPGKIGSPAASADVQPAGRSLSDDRLHVAPDPAVQPRLVWRRSYSSYSRHVLLSTSSAWRSPVDRGPPSMWTLRGIG